MSNLLQRWFTGTHTPALNGGLALPRNKQGLPNGNRIECLEVPSTVFIPLTNYHHDALHPHVQVGDEVQCGDALAEGVIASVGGRVIDIASRPIIHPSGLSVPCVEIATDQSCEYPRPVHAPQKQLTLERLALCGIQGLGGAGFGTAGKFSAALQTHGAITTLVINAVECEPVISCDEALMMTEAAEIVDAIQALIRMSDCKRCLLAIENDKEQALIALTTLIQARGMEQSVQLRTLSPIYPSGAERPLIERLTGQCLPPGSPPSQIGVVCINVATALAAWRAQQGHPMVSRIVTVAGEHAAHATNVRVTFGTTVAEVLRQTGNDDMAVKSRVRAGGPLSGFDLHRLDVPVTATTNCITVEPVRQQALPLPCIRCNACSDVCPVKIMPQQLHWFAAKDDLQQSARYRLMDCIECGCCDAVCPSSIPLTQTFRYAKGLHRAEQLKQRLAAESEERFRLREQREAERTAAREQKRKAAQARLTERSDPITDALSRIRNRKKSGASQQSSTPATSSARTRNSAGPNNEDTPE